MNKKRETTIHTRIDEKARVSSVYRKFSNSNFESYGWETFLWVDGKIHEQFKIVDNADEVVELHEIAVDIYLVFDSKEL